MSTALPRPTPYTDVPFLKLLHLSRRTIRALLLFVLALVLLFFALTRTQVGREGLRSELQRRFAESFAGELVIGKLTGNLINELYARDVRLIDARGHIVVAIDSLVARPHWPDLFRRKISVRSLTLYHPSVALRRESDGRWNLSNALQQVHRDTTGSSRPFTFNAADLEIIDGTLVTQNSGPVPAVVSRRQVFDYTNATLQDVQARATLEVQPAYQLIDLLSFSAVLPAQQFGVRAMQGQLVVEEERISLNQFSLETAETQLRLSGAYEQAGQKEAGAEALAALALELEPSHVDADEIRRILPSLPVAGALTLSAGISGPLSGLMIDHIEVTHGASHLRGEGTLLGLPDSLDFELSFPRNAVAFSDLKAVLSGVAVPDFQHLGLVEADLYAKGTVLLRAPHGAAFDVASRLSVKSTAGALNGTVSVAQRYDRTLMYAADLQAERFDVGVLLHDPALASEVNGVLRLSGEGLSPNALTGDLHASLSASTLANRPVDTLQVDIVAEDGVFDAQLLYGEGRGQLRADGGLDLTAAVPSYALDLRTRTLDVGALIRDDSLITRVNSQVTLTGQGFTWDALKGKAIVAFDTSEVRVGQAVRLVPANRVVVTLEQLANATRRVDIQGDVGSLLLEGDLRPSLLLATGRLWSRVIEDGIRGATNKPYAAHETIPDSLLLWAEDVAAAEPVSEAALKQAFLQELRARADSTVEVRAELRLRRSELISALAPSFPRLATDLQAHLSLQASPGRLQLEASVRSDSIHAGGIRIGRLQADVQATGSLDAPIESTLNVSLKASADSLRLGPQLLNAPRLDLAYHNRSGELTLETEAHERTGPLRLEAALDLLADRNRVTLRDLYLSAEGYSWANADEDPIDFYADAIVFHGLLLENRDRKSEERQRIAVIGTLSHAPTDTVFVEADNIVMRQLSTVFGMKRPIGGALNGRVALTGAYRRPELTGNLTVATLSFDNRLLGRMELSSRYVPGSPDVVLDLAINPVPSDSSLTYLPGTRIKPRLEESQLRLAGAFRLPRFGDAGDMVDEGKLDLKLEVDSAKAFFFDYLFPSLIADVQGAFSGTGTIGGTFRDPLFDASLQLNEGYFTVPDYKLAYAIEGPVTVDAEGIKLAEIHLTDPTGGRATVTGGILFNSYRFFSFALQASLDRLQVINNPLARDLAFYGRIWATGTTTLTGPVYNALLRSTDVVTSTDSEVFIPLTESNFATDPGFIIFADSSGALPDVVQRSNLIASRPAGERAFVDGLEMDLNVFAPEGSTVHLVIDPLVGDVINAVGSGRIQLQRNEGEFSTFGTLEVDGGDYLFSAGEVFYRRFLLDDGGSITWDGDPTNSVVDLQASYRTRASAAGLPEHFVENSQSLIPVIVNLHITGRLATPVVDLSLAIDSDQRSGVNAYQGWEAILNEPERSTEYATSVLLTNSFMLTTSLTSGGDSDFRTTRDQFAFNSLSQLVASQVNRYLSQALPNVDFSFGVQSSQTTQDLDVTYGIALRLLDERLIIRGQGVYQGARANVEDEQRVLQGEFVVEVRLSRTVSVEVFYRREGDALAENVLTTNTAGGGLSYQTQFSSWRQFFTRIFGWLVPDRKEEGAPPDEPVATGPGE